VIESVDARLARRAAGQHGVLTRAQLFEAGLNKQAVDYRHAIGRLQVVHRGVYAVGHTPPSPYARAMAAVLACGDGAVLSHRSAAALWGFVSSWRVPTDVTVRTDRRHPGVRVHRSRTLGREETTMHFGIPVTTPARTILDLADVFDDAALARAVNEARLLRRLDLEDLARLLERSSGRATTRLRPFVERVGAPTRSVFEDAFLHFVERHALPRPEVNQTAAGHEVDMLWREQRLIVELDGLAYHAGDEAFEVDRERDATLVAAGYSVLRLTWRRLTHHPAREAARLRSLLGNGE
jgi:very-short-patch-repair endonuclease/predicted transcriptional regulator of viral defense system